MSELVARQRPTVRRLTANVASAIAAIAIEGPGALGLVSGSLVSSKGKSVTLDAGCARFACWRFADGELADEHVVVLVRSPSLIELHCHGGMAVTDLILQQLRAAGGDTAESWPSALTHSSEHGPGSGLTEDIRAASMQALVRATTLKTALILLEQYQGTLQAEFETLQALIASGARDQARQLRETLLRRGRFGLKLLNPWRLTLAGPPNVGKSSLTNALCGAARVLVHHEPGTTRDAIETSLVIGGWPVLLTDTAGIRASAEKIEQQGIETAWRRWQQTDIGLMVIDATVGWTGEHDQLMSGPTALMIVINKIDAVEDATVVDQLSRTITDKVGSRGIVIHASAKSDHGVDSILSAISEYLDRECPAKGSVVPFTKAQLSWLESLTVSEGVR